MSSHEQNASHDPSHHDTHDFETPEALEFETEERLETEHDHANPEKHKEKHKEKDKDKDKHKEKSHDHEGQKRDKSDKKEKHHTKETRMDHVSPPDLTPMAGSVEATQPLVSVVMGSKSDWETMHYACEVLKEFGVPYESMVVSAHRTPLWLAQYAAEAESRGLEVIIAGAGGAAHLPGMVAAQTPLPVLGVPIQGKALRGMDSLLSIVQMPSGIPVGTLAIGKSGAYNAALLALSILGNKYPVFRERLQGFRAQQTDNVFAERWIEGTADYN